MTSTPKRGRGRPRSEDGRCYMNHDKQGKKNCGECARARRAYHKSRETRRKK